MAFTKPNSFSAFVVLAESSFGSDWASPETEVSSSLTKSGLFTEEKDSGKLRSYILLSKAFLFLDLHLTVGWENNKKGLRSSLTT